MAIAPPRPNESGDAPPMLIRLAYFVLALALWLASATAAFAQTPDPADAVIAQLVGYGYDVLNVGFYPDERGNVRRDVVFVQMETITADFANTYLIRQTLSGFEALAKFYPGADYYLVILQYDRWQYIFVTTPPDWDDVVQKRVKSSDFWNSVRRGARIYDTLTQQYVSEKDFVNQNQITKNQSNKDFSGQAQSPLPPTNTNPEAKPENIRLEPTTTFLPADGRTEAWLLATLTDGAWNSLPGRGVNFAYEVRGQEEKPLGVVQTDQFGIARTQIKSSRPLDLVLLRAQTATLKAAAQILIGDPPGENRKAQIRAVIEGLEAQGYTDVDADYLEETGPTGRVLRQGVAGARVTSKTFDREVYSQLMRTIGTLRTLMPDVNILRPFLAYAAPDGHDYLIVFSLTSDIWDAYVRGEIGEDQFWQGLKYDGAIDENGRRNDEKDFLTKNFTKITRYSNVPRRVESTLTAETWGEQLTVGSFVVPVGGLADTFTVAEWSGNAKGFALYATPEYTTPFFTYTKGDSLDSLTRLRLEAGQYILEVRGDAPPSKVTLDFVEHLPR